MDCIELKAENFKKFLNPFYFKKSMNYFEILVL